MRRSFVPAAAWAAVCLGSAGCSGDKAKVSGQVYADGKPYVPEKDERVTVTFYTKGEGKGMPPLAVSTHMKPDASFQLDYAGGGNYLPPRQYKIGVECLVYADGSVDPTKVKFRNQFNEDTSPFALNAEAGKSYHLKLDLTKKQMIE